MAPIRTLDGAASPSFKEILRRILGMCEFRKGIGRSNPCSVMVDGANGRCWKCNTRQLLKQL